MAKIRVTRTLVYEGDEEWVRRTLDRSYIQVGENTYNQIHKDRFELATGFGKITEVMRTTENVKD